MRKCGNWMQIEWLTKDVLGTRNTLVKHVQHKKMGFDFSAPFPIILPSADSLHPPPHSSPKRDISCVCVWCLKKYQSIYCPGKGHGWQRRMNSRLAENVQVKRGFVQSKWMFIVFQSTASSFVDGFDFCKAFLCRPPRLRVCRCLPAPSFRVIKWWQWRCYSAIDTSSRRTFDDNLMDDRKFQWIRRGSRSKRVFMRINRPWFDEAGDTWGVFINPTISPLPPTAMDRNGWRYLWGNYP